jgi:hypothetical protein
MVETEHVERPVDHEPNQFLTGGDAQGSRRGPRLAGADIDVTHDPIIVIQSERDDVGNPVTA